METLYVASSLVPRSPQTIEIFCLSRGLGLIYVAYRELRQFTYGEQGIKKPMTETSAFYLFLVSDIYVLSLNEILR